MNSLNTITVATDQMGFIERLSKNYSRRLVILLFMVYFLIKGFVTSAISLSQLPFLKNILKVNEKTYQIYILIAWTPWSTKAFMGSLSDLYPLFGYHKKWYILLSSIIGTISLCMLSFWKFNDDNKLLVPILLFMVMLQVTIVDLLCEAKYAKEMKNKTKSQGGDAVSFVWGCVVSGSFIASAFIGVFTDHFNAQYVYLICLPFILAIIYPFYMNYLCEGFIVKAYRKFKLDVFQKNMGLFFLAASIATFAIGMAIINLVGSHTAIFIYSIFVSISLCLIALRTMDLKRAKCNIYLFLMEATYIQIPGALDYWYTADSTCVENGPNFNMTYYLTYTNMVGAVASIAGIYIFQRRMSNWSFRANFLVSSMIRIGASFFDIAIVERFNIMLGVPDKVAYMFGDALIMNTASMLATMPAVMLTANNVSDGLECTTYAVLASFQNLGANVSKSIGVALMTFLDIDADVRPCKFHNLSWLIFIAHFLFPIIPIFLARYLIEEKDDVEAVPVNSEDSEETSESSVLKLKSFSAESEERVSIVESPKAVKEGIENIEANERKVRKSVEMDEEKFK